MPRHVGHPSKSHKSSSTKVVRKTPAASAPPAPPSAPVKKSRRKADQPPLVINDVPDVQEVVLDPTPEKFDVKTEGGVGVSDVVPPSTSSLRRALDRDELKIELDHFLNRLQAELDTTRELKKRIIPLQTWKSLVKDFKSLKNATLRSVKKRKKTTNPNSQSGFNKPVKISKELAQFAGWDDSELKSRREVTKFICDYIKNNNLQNPQDKRVINADDKLSELLNYSEGNEDKLTYFYLQKKIQPHFAKPIVSSV
jgi:hypothetical protein